MHKARTVYKCIHFVHTEVVINFGLQDKKSLQILTMDVGGSHLYLVINISLAPPLDHHGSSSMVLKSYDY